ncbi:MAG: phytanoyl-CoA dioxygenase family protein [Rhodospirillales bacterium]|jgi:non-haem Fe2+, alpha-ketoglutarate-dependent halogenase|nr:phytanoyl-CoA dioxygenase family protein [Rhodospirillales bacterium]MBT4041575.1 phytanoyl-CoA dioxygenase family protein [Rhodospirillales bacterium]MBT4627664.1 phytanoyl-CoA dioxygenase family protein [Rhodospirillales bacterium]MBT5352901.1 phytanoyl-CoA dioxygenase family protein [Rhodospirillales bacterium]MBT5519151.1 phytanoyl-CoA dioxygenase family protein [Rhodospirillales bacterium]
MESLKEQYDRDGFVFPIDVMSEAEAARIRISLEQAEQDYGHLPEFAPGVRSHAHFLIPQFDDITRLDAVLDSVSQILGPDILAWGCSLFLKEAHTEHFISWHQDLTYWGLDDVQELTAWVALSAATVESGCMRYVAGSHTQPIVPHRDTFGGDNLLSRGQEIAVTVDEGAAVPVVLKPGQMAIHHGHMFHASGPNISDDRRIGLAIQFISPSMRQTDGARVPVSLVRGEDRFGHFDVMTPPRETMSDEGRAIVRSALNMMGTYLYDGAEEVGRRSDLAT